MKIVSLLSFFLLTAAVFASDGLDSLLNVQRIRAGDRASQIFDVLDKSGSDVTAEEIADLRFLIAYMPLSDLAAMDGQLLLNNVRLARKAKHDFVWGAQIDEELFRSFVLPYRVSQEPFVSGWREQFLFELRPRLKGMSMTQAALEVNHWCHEKVTYKASDSRDQDPLTTIRAGLGRCEEEMIFAICALRSVGIPARQCYTPFWAHMDDNHAWTEMWADGQWHYFGACEPEPVLDKGWFSDAAARAMLVVSTSYGDYHGSEPVLRRYGRSTLLNSTNVYGNTTHVNIRLVDKNSKPLAKTKVYFNLFNYGCLMPAMALETGVNGTVTLDCGIGTWFVSAGQGNYSALQCNYAGRQWLSRADSDRSLHVRGRDEERFVDLKFDKVDNLTKFTEAQYSPPPEQPAKKLALQDSLFQCRFKTEDSLREGFWQIWADDLGTIVGHAGQYGAFQLKPDSVWVSDFASAHKLDSKKLLETLRNARGNWGVLFRFLTGHYPMTTVDTNADQPKDLNARFALLDNLTEKDARDFSLEVLTDHFEHSSIENPLSMNGVWEGIASLDSADRQRYEENVIAPRIDQEPSIPWRNSLCNFFKTHPNLLKPSSNDEAIFAWIKKNIKLDEEKDRLGPPLTPAQTFGIMRGSQSDIERLYVGLCRVRSIPARFNPVTGRLERWDNHAWAVVDLKLKARGKSKPVRTGTLTIVAASDTTVQQAQYFKDWGVAKWETDHLADQDFGYHDPYSKIKWPQELPEGLYCLSSGFRNKDGSASISFKWFKIEAGKTSKVDLSFRNNGQALER